MENRRQVKHPLHGLERLPQAKAVNEYNITIGFVLFFPHSFRRYESVYFMLGALCMQTFALALFDFSLDFLSETVTEFYSFWHYKSENDFFKRNLHEFPLFTRFSPERHTWL